ncbi:glutaredoxin 3 [Natronospira proteinivora]|uniref:Glutaredoxin n=1 Tax=Natronospira proteinivora TaxID=1807133 RepID=A0ABT1G9V4_9GAMM|nr:glutaredoxin 3 [Natronospira proteinivora]MCP1728104.1 glutaredoxin 3 [Natronospira proteinivora]
MSEKPVVMYSKRSCPFCVRAKALMEAKGVAFEEIDILVAPERRQEMIEKADGRRTVPQIFIQGEGIGGYDELAALERVGELNKRLGL